MSLLSDISDAILDVDSEWDGDYGTTNINTMKREGWEDAVAKQINENPTKVTSSTISSGSVASGTDSDWGLDHFRSGFKTTLLNGTTLFPYKATLSGYIKYMVIINANIHRFNDSSSAWFDGTHSAVPDFCAAYFFGTKGDTDNQDAAIANGNNAITGYNYSGA